MRTPILALTLALAACSGGTLAATTYYVRQTYTGTAGESAPSPTIAIAVPANNVLVVSSPGASAGATGWNGYVATMQGSEELQNAAPTAIGMAWTEPTSGLVSGAVAPTPQPSTSTFGLAHCYSQNLNWGSKFLSGQRLIA